MLKCPDCGSEEIFTSQKDRNKNEWIFVSCLNCELKFWSGPEGEILDFDADEEFGNTISYDNNSETK